VRTIGWADVLLVDDLVDRRVLAHARPGARIVEVGKRGGNPSTPQRFIERLLVHEALAGRRVVRLKGGDPMVFGRAGEEIDALRAAGLSVEVVPGIGAASGAAASLGLSLTDRRIAPGVAFVTGHAQPGGFDTDWAALARSGLTLVIYMGMRRSAHVAAALIAAGRAGHTPTLIVRGATLPGETRQRSTLADLAAGGIHDAKVEVAEVGEVGEVATVAEETRGAAEVDQGLLATVPGGAASDAPGLIIIGDVAAGWLSQPCRTALMPRDAAATLIPTAEPACHAA
jgi:uroporphyrin-III C-methyltransferase